MPVCIPGRTMVKKKEVQERKRRYVFQNLMKGAQEGKTERKGRKIEKRGT